MDNITLRVRASSWADLADCPARWYARNIDGMRTPSGGPSILGTAIHASTAAFDRSGIEAGGLTVNDTAGVLVDTLRQPAEDVDWTDSPFTPREAEAIGLNLHTQYCTRVAPGRQYVEVEPTLGAVEIEVPESRVTVVLTGTTDRIRVVQGHEGISDLKSGQRAVSADGTVETKGHAYQLAAYQLLRRVSTGRELTAPGEIIGLNTGKTPAAQRVGVGTCERVEDTLLGTKDRPGMIQAAASMARAGMFFGNPKSMLCSPKYCPAYGVCQFRR